MARGHGGTSRHRNRGRWVVRAPGERAKPVFFPKAAKSKKKRLKRRGSDRYRRRC